MTRSWAGGIRRGTARLRDPRERTIWWFLAVMFLGQLALAPALFAVEIVIYGFEGSLDGWVIPDWAKTSPDYVALDCTVSQSYHSEGHDGMELSTAFPGDRWSGAYVEREVEVTDWSPFGRLSVDLYLPQDAPRGLTGKIILTVGDDWQWTEMNRSLPLQPGAWTTISVNLKSGSMDWKFFPDDTFRQNVRKIGVRIESEKGLAYRGPVFLDNVRLAE